MLVSELGDEDISGVTLNLLREYSAKQSEHLKPCSLRHHICSVSSLFRFAMKKHIYLAIHPLKCMNQK
ncbi:hypothetical protein ACINKY_17715 [Paenibacillus illinoisensis]|uniref:Uncharacterized protein n=1 Tax=Paenibacillus illinoisensis TaxID=59845 RepID=A0ABW8HWI7_9BACL